MALSNNLVAGLSLAGNVCDALGGLYLAYDVFRRHAGPLGLLTRTATYSVVLTIPAWITLGPAFGAISGCGLGALVSFEYWKLARRQRLQRSSPLHQSWAAGAARGAVLGLASIPRFGWHFGLVLIGTEALLLGLIYGAGLVPTFRLYPGRWHAVSRSAVWGAIWRALGMGAAATAAALIVRGLGAAESLGPLIAVLVALAGLGIMLTAPVVEYWTENAHDAFFIYAGLSLLFLGLVCDSVPSIAVLLGAAP